jgi:hypothetical protein
MIQQDKPNWQPYGCLSWKAKGSSGMLQCSRFRPKNPMYVMASIDCLIAVAMPRNHNTGIGSLQLDKEALLQRHGQQMPGAAK